MPKKKKDLKEEELEKLHQEFSQALADKIYENAEKLGEAYHKKYNYDSSISIFNVMLSISANYAVELGISANDFAEVCKDFWGNANELITTQEKAYAKPNDWLEPKTKNKKELS